MDEARDLGRFRAHVQSISDLADAGARGGISGLPNLEEVVRGVALEGSRFGTHVRIPQHSLLRVSGRNARQQAAPGNYPARCIYPAWTRIIGSRFESLPIEVATRWANSREPLVYHILWLCSRGGKFREVCVGTHQSGSPPVIRTANFLNSSNSL